MIRRKKATRDTAKDSERNQHPFAVHEGGQANALNVEAIFQPDILIQSQYEATHQRRYHQEPEKVLMLALLEDGVVCFQDNLGSTCKRKRALYEDAESWILDSDSSYVFSFENICSVLGVDAGYLRGGLLRWKESKACQLEKEPRRRLAS